MLLSKHFISIVVEHLAAPAQQTRVIGPLVRLLHYVGGVLVRLVELEGLEHALYFETDEVYRAAALLEQLVEISDGLVEVFLLNCFMNQALCDFEISQQLLILLIDCVVRLDGDGLLQVNTGFGQLPQRNVAFTEPVVGL